MLGLTAADFWIMATASLVAVSCALLGCFLVLRRLSLLGDAISHAVLPGLAVAFMLTGTRDLGPMLLGALAAGVLTALLTHALHHAASINLDASMGIVFTTLFALGVILINIAARHVDLDPGCVLYGLIEYTTLDTVRIAGIEMPRAFAIMSVTAILNIAFVTLLYKELRLVSFDPLLAASVGISPAIVHYALMTAVAGTTVASFESVGSILVVAMLIGPAATAHLLTDRLAPMLWTACALGVACAIGGYLAALHFNTSVAGMMGVMAGIEFALAAVFAPRHGVVGRALHRLPLALRIHREDMLAHLYRAQERSQSATRAELMHVEPARSRPQQVLRRAALGALVRGKLVERDSNADTFALSSAGHSVARELVRSHRLWETYLAERVGLPPDHVHEPAHRAEHFITPAMREQLDRTLGQDADPHGSAIPQPPHHSEPA